MTRPKSQSKSQPTWKDVKAKLACFDQPGLLSLVQDLYAANQDNRAFLHARFGLGDDSLEPYAKTIDRWLWPDVIRNQFPSVAKAKQAIADYKKAVGDPAGLAELMVFYCERAVGFANSVGFGDDSFFNALLGMFEHALKISKALPTESRDDLIARLDEVRFQGSDIGYGVGDSLGFLFEKYTRRTSED